MKVESHELCSVHRSIILNKLDLKLLVKLFASTSTSNAHKIRERLTVNV